MKTKIRFKNEGKANNVDCENSSIPQRELTLMWKSLDRQAVQNFTHNRYVTPRVL